MGNYSKPVYVKEENEHTGNHSLGTMDFRLRKWNSIDFKMKNGDIVNVATSVLNDYIHNNLRKVFRRKVEPVLDKDGLQVLDENGEPKVKVRKFFVIKDKFIYDNGVKIGSSKK